MYKADEVSALGNLSSVDREDLSDEVASELRPH